MSQIRLGQPANLDQLRVAHTVATARATIADGVAVNGVSSGGMAMI
jgi:hypothetical protein